MQQRHPPITLVCETCGTSFRRRFSQHKHRTEKRGITHVYCSKACKNVGEREPLPASIATEYQSGLTLAAVAARHGVSPAHVRNALLERGIPMRSRAWHLSTDRNPTKGKGHTPEAVAKIRAANVRQFSDPAARLNAAHNQRRAMSEGRIKCSSALEDAVAAELDLIGVAYIRQAPIRDPLTGRFCACVDFLLESGDALEVNGTYWHTDPRTYPDGPVHASQRRVAEQYERKRKYLALLDIPLREVWEADFRADPPGAVRTALER